MPGPGLISMKRLAPMGMSALLYNFEIGSSELKPEHTIWIQSILLPWSSLPKTGFMIVGLTSRTGKDSYNMALSKNRAEAVSHTLTRFTHGMPIETLVYYGERAAALVGIQDGVEDPRWRAVWVHVGEERSPPFVSPPRFEARRSLVTIVRRQKMSNEGRQDGDAGYQAGEALRGSTGMRTGIIGEKTILVDVTFGLTRVTIESTTTSDGLPLIAESNVDYLRVSYEWGEWARHVTFVIKNLIQARGPPKNHVTSINPVMANDWLTRPLWAFEHKLF